MEKTEEYVIIVAGGKGLRMGGDVPKQFLPIGGVPVLMRTLMRFREYSSGLRMILVLPKAQQEYWGDLCRQYSFPLRQLSAGEPFAGDGYKLADGGQTRFHSVQGGLALVPDDADGVVGVHDGVRPFVSVDVIRGCYDAARTRQAVVPVVPVVESLRRIVEHPAPETSNPMSHPSALDALSPTLTSHSVARSDYRLVQTPQVFGIQLLKAANRQPYRDTFTDDASVVEAFGHGITLVEGNRENIKITTPFDLKIAETII